MSTPTAPAQAPLIDRVCTLARGWQRPEIAERMEGMRTLKAEAVANVVVGGETNVGKSRFVNALVGYSVCPVDVEVASNALVSIAHGSTPKATVFSAASPRGRAIAVEEIEDWASEQLNPMNELGVERVEVSVPSDLLEGGIRLIDTPGVGGLNAAHRQLSLAALAWADALLFLLEPGAPVSRPEREFLNEAAERIGGVIFVVTKTDLYPDWISVAEEDRRLIASHAERFAQAPFLAVSSLDKEEAEELEDRELRAASGFSEIEYVLREHVAGRAARLRVWNLARAVSSAVDELEGPERLTLQERSDDSTDEPLKSAKAAVDKYTRRTRRWSSTLSIEHQRRVANPCQLELRRRLRDLPDRYERRIASRDFDVETLPSELDAELRGLAFDIRARVAEETEKLIRSIAETYDLATLDQVPPELVDGPIDLAPLDGTQTKAGSGLSGRFLGASSLARRSLYGHQFFIALGPIGWAAGATLGGAMLVSSQFTQRRTRGQQDARSTLSRAMDPARVEIDADLRARLLSSRQFAQDELQLLVEERKASLDAQVKRLERIARQDARDRKRARASARERLEELAPLRAEADQLCRQAEGR